MTDPRIESKIRALEQEVAELKRRLDAACIHEFAPPFPPSDAVYCAGGRGHVFAQQGDVMICSGCGTSYLVAQCGNGWQG